MKKFKITTTVTWTMEVEASNKEIALENYDDDVQDDYEEVQTVEQMEDEYEDVSDRDWAVMKGI